MVIQKTQWTAYKNEEVLTWIRNVTLLARLASIVFSWRGKNIGIKGDKFPGKHELNLVSMDSLVLWSEKLNGDWAAT